MTKYYDVTYLAFAPTHMSSEDREHFWQRRYIKSFTERKLAEKALANVASDPNFRGGEIECTEIDDDEDGE